MTLSEQVQYSNSRDGIKSKVFPFLNDTRNTRKSKVSSWSLTSPIDKVGRKTEETVSGKSKGHSISPLAAGCRSLGEFRHLGRTWICFTSRSQGSEEHLDANTSQVWELRWLVILSFNYHNHAFMGVPMLTPYQPFQIIWLNTNSTLILEY